MGRHRRQKLQAALQWATAQANPTMAKTYSANPQATAAHSKLEAEASKRQYLSRPRA